MKEAEADPGLRALSGLGETKKTEGSKPRQDKIEKRPYRTQQDLVIREKEDVMQQQWLQQQKQKQQLQQQQQQRRQQQLRRPQVEVESLPPPSRSKSADARGGGGGAGASFGGSGRHDPKLQSFKRSSSNDNFTEEIMHEVVTDTEHHSVKDLVRMIERNTKSESANPYVRKWGCDLISPEPHTKNVTYRRERKDMVMASGMGMGMGRKQQQQLHQEQDEWYLPNGTMDETARRHQPLSLDNEFRMSAHVADLDSLLGRPPLEDGHEDDLGADSDHCSRPHEVTWPPPSPTQDHPSRSPIIRRDESMGSVSSSHQHQHQHQHQQQHQQQQHHQSRSHSSPSVSKKPPLSTSSSLKKSDENLIDLDRHISSLQSGFSSQLDSMLREKTTKQRQQQSATSSSSISSSKKKGQQGLPSSQL